MASHASSGRRLSSAGLPQPGGRRRDPLLGTVRIALTATMAAAVIFAAGTLAAIPLVIAWRVRILGELSQRAGKALPADLPYVLCGVMVLIVVTAVLGFLFLRLLRRIIDSVADGDPFIPENAARLRLMAWLAVTVQLLAIPAGIQAGWISYVTHVNYVNVGFSFGGAILALILFVLARVFSKGAEMRDELEGTV